MATYNPLAWQNQNGLSNYPLTTSFESQDFLTDAKFIQFDGYIPTLDYVFVENNSVKLAISFDYGQNTNIIFSAPDYIKGEAYRRVRIYQPRTDRFVGVLCFGEGVKTLWTSKVGRKIQVNSPFDSATTISIPSKSAVYTLDDLYGPVTLSRTEIDKTLFYNNNQDLSTVTFNAVTNSEVSGEKQGLRKINLVSPINNNINLAANDVIKLSSLNSSSLVVELVTGTASQNFTLAKLTS